MQMRGDEFGLLVEKLLREIGVDYAQGFLRHHPVALDEIFDTLPFTDQ